ncbi:hypothetical protein AVEN_67247-1 [Araneus ventricosus]|uniref:Uncharacterized protein n=1 Tax=Araneus ventricosus TaxID=182803 RepID=A0A4Y2Q0T0_ARAVE|nr:hypothetical protein AVEN_67247-1 [Araneus ventricosus]
MGAKLMECQTYGVNLMEHHLSTTKLMGINRQAPPYGYQTYGAPILWCQTYGAPIWGAKTYSNGQSYGVPNLWGANLMERQSYRVPQTYERN